MEMGGKKLNAMDIAEEESLCFIVFRRCYHLHTLYVGVNSFAYKEIISEFLGIMVNFS